MRGLRQPTSCSRPPIRATCPTAAECQATQRPRASAFHAPKELASRAVRTRFGVAVTSLVLVAQPRRGRLQPNPPSQ